MSGAASAVNGTASSGCAAGLVHGALPPARQRAAALGLIAAGLLLQVATAAAQKVPVGPEFLVNEQTYGYQGTWRGPDLAPGAAGGFVVVWDGYGDSTGGRRFKAGGIPLGGDFAFSLIPSYLYNDDPAIDSAADGRFVVVWQDTSYYYMVAQRYNANGAPIGSAFKVNIDDSRSPRNPKVAVQDDGTFMVVWGQFDTSGYGISGRMFDADGTALGGEFSVDTAVGDSDGYNGAEEDDDGIEVAAGADGSFMVVWQNYDYPLGLRILGRLFDSAGTPTGLPFQVNTSPDPLGYPGVAADGLGNFIVVWSGDYGSTIEGRRFDGTGAPLGPSFVVATPSEFGFAAKVDADAAGNFVVVWQDYPQVVGRQFDSAENPLPGDFALSQTVDMYGYNYSAYAPDVAFTSNRDFVVAWRTESGDYDYPPNIMAQRFTTPAAPCNPAPKTTCRVVPAAKGSLFRYKTATNPKSSTLLWRWAKGEATDSNAFGDPLTDTDYTLCVYDASASSQPVLEAGAAGGGPCGAFPCWRVLVGPGPTIQYFDHLTSVGGASNPDGIRLIRLRPGAAGKARIEIQGRGQGLSLPAAPLSLPIVVQAQASNGECWTATYDVFVTENESGELRARSTPP